MTKAELITAFQLGDLCEVEFFELAQDAGLSLEEIGEILEMEREDAGYL